MSLLAGLVCCLHASRARLRRGPTSNTDTLRRSTWHDLAGWSDGALANFAWTTASGWAGSGSPGDPHRLVLDGADDRVAMTLPNVVGSGTYALEAWVLLAAAPSANGAVLAATNADGTGNVRTALRITSARQPVLFTMNGSGTFKGITGPALALNVWHHLVGIVDGTSGELWVNGTRYTGAMTSMAGTQSVHGTLGCWRWSQSTFTEFLGMQLAVARVWGRRLASSEVAELYASGPLWVPPLPQDMLSGRLQVVVGDSLEDVTASLLRELEWSTVAPGGYGSASLRLRAAGHDRPYSGSVSRGSQVAIRELSGGQAQSLWEGVVATDVSRPRLSGGQLAYEVECAGPQALLAARDDYCRTWADEDLGQWRESPSASQDYQIETDGELVIQARKGQAYRGGRYCSVFYWLDEGLGPAGDAIDHLEWTIGSAGVSLPASGIWRVRVQAATSPWGTRTTVLEWDSANDVPGGPGTVVRVPASGSLPSGTRCLWLAFGAASDGTAGEDRWLSASRLVVYRSPSAVRIDQALADIVAGVASSTSTQPVGSARTDLVVRPFTTRAEAIESLAALHEAPVWWRWAAGRVFAVSAYPDPGVAGYLAIDPTRPGVDVELELDPEGAPEYCTVAYISAGIIQGQQPVVPAGYVASLTVDASGQPQPSLPASARVATLDLRDAERSLYPAQAVAVGRRYLAWCGAATVSGTVTLHVDEVETSAGTRVLPHQVTAGTWCLVTGYMTRPALVTEARYSASDGTLELTLGVPRAEWSPDEPYPTARAEAAVVVGGPAKARYHRRRRR